MGNARALKDLNINMSPANKKTLDYLRNHNQQEKLRLFLLTLIEEKVKGQAEEAAKVGTGPMKILLSDIKELQKAYGKTISEFSKDSFIMNSIKSMVKYLSELNPEYKKMIVSSLAFLAILGPITIGLSMVIKSIVIWKTATTFLLATGFLVNLKTYISLFFALARAEGVASAAMYILDIAMSANPIGLLIIGIAALGTGIYLLVKYWDKVTDSMVRAYRWILKMRDVNNWGKDENKSVMDHAGTSASWGDKGAGASSGWDELTPTQKLMKQKMSPDWLKSLRYNNKMDAHIIIETDKNTRIREVSTNAKITKTNTGYNFAHVGGKP